VQAVLEEARSHGATIVVLPELTVDPEVRRRLRQWLRENPSHPFALVVAGSFHESRPGVEAGPGQGVARVFDAFGDEVLAHVKLRPMRTEKKDRRIAEDLEGSRKVDLVLAPFGLLGVAICLDFCESGDVAVANLWTRVGPALMLVPSMGGTSTNNAHGRRAEDLARVHGTATVVASQHHEEKAALGLCWRVSRTTNGEPTVDAVSCSPVLLDELRW
jgi:predicted amidohydrolase